MNTFGNNKGGNSYCTHVLLTRGTQYRNFNSNYLDKAGYPESANKTHRHGEARNQKNCVSDSNPASAKHNSSIARTMHGAMAVLQP